MCRMGPEERKRPRSGWGTEDRPQGREVEPREKGRGLEVWEGAVDTSAGSGSPWPASGQCLRGNPVAPPGSASGQGTTEGSMREQVHCRPPGPRPLFRTGRGAVPAPQPGQNSPPPHHAGPPLGRAGSWLKPGPGLSSRPPNTHHTLTSHTPHTGPSKNCFSSPVVRRYI